MSEIDQRAYEGGGFLVEATDVSSCFAPEDFDKMEQSMAEAAEDFYQKHVYAHLESMERGELSQVPGMLDRAAEQGLLGLNIPATYEGLDLSTQLGLLVTEVLSKNISFSTTYGVHTGIGMLPILYYGTEEQKKRYLPRLIRAEYKGCYCLTEPGAGSDPASGTSRAVLKDDHYLLSGQKIWISNAGFADIFIVFAKVEEHGAVDDQLSAFIVEKSYGGIELQDEEEKMGLKGSSTRQAFFNNCPVPRGQLLGLRGQGFKIAVNILNIGRLKLAMSCIGGAKDALAHAIEHSKARKQFGAPLSTFGAIRQKIGEACLRIYASESAIYRCAGAIDQAIQLRKQSGRSSEEARIEAMEAFSIECALLKVHASEVLAYATDESVQIHGGMGYSEDAPIAGFYRNARITRIYEGTNEINRIFSVSMLLRRLEKGLLPFHSEDFEPDPSLPLQQELEICSALKQLLFRLIKVSKKQLTLRSEQELLMCISEVASSIYTTESALLRAAKLKLSNHTYHGLAESAAIYLLQRAQQRVRVAGEDIIHALSLDTKEYEELYAYLHHTTRLRSESTLQIQSQIAASAIEVGHYPFIFY